MSWKDLEIKWNLHKKGENSQIWNGFSKKFDILEAKLAKPKIREMKSNMSKSIVFTFFKNEKRFRSFSWFFLNWMNTRLMMRERWVGQFYGSCDTMEGKVETFQLKILII